MAARRRPFAQRRIDAGLSVGQVAVRLNCSDSHLRALERGSRPLTWPMAQALANVYGCTIEQLVRVTDGLDENRCVRRPDTLFASDEH